MQFWFWTLFFSKVSKIFHKKCSVTYFKDRYTWISFVINISKAWTHSKHKFTLNIELIREFKGALVYVCVYVFLVSVYYTKFKILLGSFESLCRKAFNCDLIEYLKHLLVLHTELNVWRQRYEISVQNQQTYVSFDWCIDCLKLKQKCVLQFIFCCFIPYLFH